MWQPVTQQGNLTERIVGQVEQLILDERLKPGDRLPSERDIAALLGVSRPSMREAVRILQANGRVEVRHGQGVFVTAPHSERALRQRLASEEITLNELYAMREVLEVPAGGWAAEKASDEQLAGLRAVLDRMVAVLDAGEPDFDELGRLDADFHMHIAIAAGNRFLRQTSHVLYDILRSGMETTLTIPGRPVVAQADHERIWAALSARDPASTRRAVRSHIRGAHHAAIRRIEAQQHAASDGDR